MASIILMKTSEFINEFCGKYNHRNFNFLLISNDVKTKGKYNNVTQLRSLLPPTNAVSAYLNGSDKQAYHQKYYKHLASAQNDSILTTVVKLAAIDDTNIVFLCTDDEAEIKYLKPLQTYIETVFYVKVCKFKEYRQNEKKCECNINPKKTNKALAYKFKVLQEKNVGVPSIRAHIYPKLQEMKTKQLIKFAESKGIYVKKDISREKLLKKIDKELWGK